MSLETPLLSTAAWLAPANGRRQQNGSVQIVVPSSTNKRSLAHCVARIRGESRKAGVVQKPIDVEQYFVSSLPTVKLFDNLELLELKGLAVVPVVTLATFGD